MRHFLTRVVFVYIFSSNDVRIDVFPPLAEFPPVGNEAPVLC